MWHTELPSTVLKCPVCIIVSCCITYLTSALRLFHMHKGFVSWTQSIGRARELLSGSKLCTYQTTKLNIWNAERKRPISNKDFPQTLCTLRSKVHWSDTLIKLYLTVIHHIHQLSLLTNTKCALPWWHPCAVMQVQLAEIFHYKDKCLQCLCHLFSEHLQGDEW